MAYTTRADVFGKVDWEGGIDEVQRYGLSLEDLPEDDHELREAWQAMADAWAVYQPLSDKVYIMLEEGAYG